MFAHHCTACDKRQLVFPSQVTSLDNTERGISVTFNCWCGAEQVWLTGAATQAAAAVPSAGPARAA